MKQLILFLILLLAPAIVHADLAPLEVTEEDASPSTFPYKVKFTNGTVTDNGDGTTSVSSGGSSGITIGTTAITSGTDTRVLFDDAGVIGEDAGFTYVKGTDALTVVGVVTAGDVTLSSAAPSLVFTDSAGDDFEHDLTSSVYRIANTTDAVTSLIHYSNNNVGLGEVGFAPTGIKLITDGTGNGEVILPTDSIGVDELDTVDDPSNGESLTFQASSGRMIWAGGGSSNSFETIAVPDTNNPVADSSTDTLTFTESAGLDITGNSTTDTINLAPDFTELTTLTLGVNNFTNLLFSSAGNDYEIATETSGGFRIENTGTGAIPFIARPDGSVGIGEVGKEIAYVTMNTTQTGNSAVRLPLDSVGPQELDSVDEPADGELYSFQASTGRGQWAAAGGGGSPGGSGTELQVRAGASTFGAVTGSSTSGADVTLAGSLNLSGASAQLDFIPASGDTWHTYVGPGYWDFTDKTTGLSYMRFQAGGTKVVFSGGNITLGVGAGNRNVLTSGSTLDISTGITVGGSGTSTLNERLTVNGSGGRPAAAVGGSIYQNTTTTSNVSSSETDLWSQSIPANVLSSDGDAIHFKFGGTIQTSINSKTLKVKFGGTTIFDSTAQNPVAATDWLLEGTIWRTGAATQKALVGLNTTGGSAFVFCDYATSTATLSLAQILVVTGTGGASTEVTFEAGRIWFEPI